MTTMPRDRVRELLHPFVDGELEADEMAAVSAAIEGYPECQGELDELVAVRALAREAFLAPAEEADLSGVYDGVMARIAADADAQLVAGEVARAAPPAAAAPRPDLLARLGARLGSLLRFEQPLVSMAAAACLVVLVGLAWLTLRAPLTGAGGGASVGPEAGPQLVSDDPDERRTRRPMELEGRNAAYVEAPQIAEGTFRVAFDESDPDAPMVVWHLVDGEGGEGVPRADTPDASL